MIRVILYIVTNSTALTAPITKWCKNREGQILATTTFTDPPVSDFIFFSEYIEGASPTASNKALEIYNPTNSSIDLNTYSIKNYPNGSSTPNSTYALTGTLASGNVIVICNSSWSPTPDLACNLITSNSVLSFNGNDSIALFNNSTAIDCYWPNWFKPRDRVGIWSVTTADHDLVRKLFNYSWWSEWKWFFWFPILNGMVIQPIITLI